MSRFPLLKTALVTALALSNVGGLCCYEPEEADVAFVLKPGELETELEACLSDDLACETLCVSALEQRGFVDEYTGAPAITRCIIETTDVPGGEPETIVRTRYMLPYDCVGGRLPSSACDGVSFAADPGARGSVGIRLALTAELEAVSVGAFVELARDLQRMGAPTSLVKRALRAAADEVDHAAAVATLARSHGARVAAVDQQARSAGPLPTRGLFDIALLNATEGCVRELFGALVCAWQARHALDSETRRVFAEIARDELHHAELSYDIARFCEAKLDFAEINAVHRAQDEALRDLARTCGTDDAELARTLGLPLGTDARRLTRAVTKTALSMRAT